MSTKTLLKRILYGFTFLMTIGGGALLAVGIWTVVDYGNFALVFGTNNLLFQHASYIAICMGAVIFAVGLFGFFGTYNNNTCLLKIFIGAVAIVLVVEVAAVVIAFAFNAEIEKFIGEHAVTSIQIHYGRLTTVEGTLVTSAWDTTQTTLKCCGYFNGTDYFGSYYHSLQEHQTPGIKPWPLSCCTRNSGGCYINFGSCTKAQEIDISYTNAQTGCLPSLRDTLKTYSAVIGGVTIAFMATQCIVIAISCWIHRNIKEGHAYV